MSNGERREPKRISTAFAELLEAIYSRLPTWREYDQVFLTDDSGHLQRLADKYFRRARRLRFLSCIVLFSSFAVIVYGISVFLRPTKFADLGKAAQQLDTSQKEINELRKAISENQTALANAQDRQDLVGIFFEIWRFLSSYEAGKSRLAGNPAFQSKLVNAIAALERLASPTPEKLLVNFESYHYYKQGGASSEIPATVFKNEARSFSEQSIRIPALKDSFTELQAVTEAAEEANCVARLKETLLPVKDLMAERERSVRDLQAKAEDFMRSSRDIDERLQAADQRKDQILLEASRPRAAIDGFESWIPMLTIRIGVVVLLLYITKALLETYRYTLMLSSYFAARGDAIQFLSRKTRGSLIDVKEFVQLVPLLSPDTYKLDRIVAPDETLARLAAAARQ